MQIMTIFIDQFLSEKSEIDGKANTLAMVFVRYTMDHDCRAYGTPIIIHGISTLTPLKTTPKLKLNITPVYPTPNASNIIIYNIPACDI